jgi:hypothetical protein
LKELSNWWRNESGLKFWAATTVRADHDREILFINWCNLF